MMNDAAEQRLNRHDAARTCAGHHHVQYDRESAVGCMGAPTAADGALELAPKMEKVDVTGGTGGKEKAGSLLLPDGFPNFASAPKPPWAGRPWPPEQQVPKACFGTEPNRTPGISPAPVCPS